MAAFSFQYYHQQQPLMNLDLVSHNFQKTSADLIIDESNINPTNCFPQLYQTKYNEHSFTNKTCTADSSSITDKLESTDEQVIQKVTSSMNNKKRKSKEGSTSNSANAKKKNNKVMKEDEEKKPKENKKDRKNGSEEAPSGYIHVRARRGQATDSHSLAERVRREKISERMKLLKALVPGCDKVTGKALMLDEIINYVQSLQNQVEFLSMKLASMSPTFYDFGMDLDSFMVRPYQRLGDLAPPVQNVPMISDTSNANNYSQLDNSAFVLFQQSQIAHIFSQGNGQALWEVDEQRQKLSNQKGFTSNLCSFQ